MQRVTNSSALHTRYMRHPLVSFPILCYELLTQHTSEASPQTNEHVKCGSTEHLIYNRAMRGKPAEKLRPGTPQSVAEVLRDHVVLELEGIDRMYLNVYVPVLQAVEGVLQFIRVHRAR